MVQQITQTFICKGNERIERHSEIKVFWFKDETILVQWNVISSLSIRRKQLAPLIEKNINHTAGKPSSEMLSYNSVILKGKIICHICKLT